MWGYLEAPSIPMPCIRLVNCVRNGLESVQKMTLVKQDDPVGFNALDAVTVSITSDRTALGGCFTYMLTHDLIQVEQRPGHFFRPEASTSSPSRKMPQLRPEAGGRYKLTVI